MMVWVVAAWRETAVVGSIEGGGFEYVLPVSENALDNARG